MYVGSVGGLDYADTTRNILKKMISYELGSLFCMEGIRGVNGKRPFRDLRLMKAVTS